MAWYNSVVAKMKTTESFVALIPFRGMDIMKKEISLIHYFRKKCGMMLIWIKNSMIFKNVMMLFLSMTAKDLSIDEIEECF